MIETQMKLKLEKKTCALVAAVKNVKSNNEDSRSGNTL